MASYFKLLFFIYFCVAQNFKAIHSHRYWTVSCRSVLCQQGLDLCISTNCLGHRQCKAIINEYYSSCSLCANEILDNSQHELINGNYYPICDSEDDLHVKACLFYCRSNYNPNGECVKENNVPICKCVTGFTIPSTTSITITTTTIATSPFGSVLLTLTGHINSVKAVAVLHNGDLASGSDDQTVKIWNPYNGSLIRTLTGHTGQVRALTVLQNGDLVSGSCDKLIKIWNPIDGSLKRTLIGHNRVWALALLENGNLVSASDDRTIKIWSTKS